MTLDDQYDTMKYLKAQIVHVHKSIRLAETDLENINSELHNLMKRVEAQLRRPGEDD